MFERTRHKAGLPYVVSPPLALAICLSGPVALAQAQERAPVATPEEDSAPEKEAQPAPPETDATSSEGAPTPSERGEEAAAAGETTEAAPLVQAPQVLKEAPVQTPDEWQTGASVSLSVTIQPDGSPHDIRVESGAGPAADQAAIQSLKNWEFSPATRDGTAIAARILVSVQVPPVEKVEPAPLPLPTTPLPPADTASPEPREEVHDHPEDDVHMEVTVHGDRPLRTERRSSGDYFIHREVLTSAPHQEGADALRAAPGLSLFRTEGLATAHSYSLRGFDAEHGQDIEFEVGGLPINQRSHIHGQGYADLGFLIGDVVDSVSVSEGVSDPRQGDFAVAGSVRVGLGVDEEHRGLQLRVGYGSFNTKSVNMVWAPKESARESLGAAQITDTDGFGENRAGQSASGIVQHRFGEGPVTFRAVGFVHGARAQSAGVLRQDDIDSGAVCYTCVYDDPSALAQNGLAQRIMAGIFADYRGKKHANGTLGFYLGRDHFRSQNNFTGYLQSSQSLPGVSGRGDLIEQQNSATTVGLTGRYRTEAFEPSAWAHGTLEVGLDGRYDGIAQQQNLLDGSVRNQIWDERVDATISALETALWADLDWQFGKKIHARAGLRAAVLSYDVHDRLGNFAPLSRPQDQSLPGFHRSSMGTTLGPRASIEVKALPWLRVLSSYGEGYRSPQARSLEEGEEAPFAKVRSVDAGLRFLAGSALDMTLSGYFTQVSDDVSFDASEGRLEAIGPTRRMGAVGYAVTRPTDWLLGSLSVTYVNTAVLEPPAPTAEDPNPPFQKGQPLPFVSPLTIRLDTKASAPLFETAPGKPLLGHVGLGMSYLAARALPYNQEGNAIPLLDASAGLAWSVFDFNIAAFNLLNVNYAAQEYFFVSDWDPGAPTSKVPAKHIAAGAPLSLMATLGITL